MQGTIVAHIKQPGLKKKYFFHSILVLLLLPLLALKSDAKTLYWVGNSGNWNDASHWSAVSGGTGGVGTPGSATDVVFDRNSFNFPNETVMINGAADCHNMQWTDDVYFPVVKGSTASSLTVSGSFGMALNMLWQYTGNLVFNSSVQNNVISTYGRTLPGNVTFNGSGSWQLNGFLMLSSSSTLTLSQGTLRANGNVVQCGILHVSGSKSKTLDISNSTLFINKQIDSAGASNFSCNSVNALIYFKNYSSVSSFNTLMSKPPQISAIKSFDTTVVRPSCNCNDTDGTNGKAKCCDGKIVISNVVSFDSGATFGYKWSTGATIDSVMGVCASLGTISCTITDSTDLSHKTVIINVSIPQLNIPNEIPKPPRCNGDCNGWIISDISGGTPTYSFKWNIGLPGSGSGIAANTNFIDSSLCAGTYTLTVTDAHSCKNTFIFPLSQPKVITVTATSTNVLCNSACNGTASVVTTSGGHGSPYTYKWAPGGQTTTSISALCPGTYTVTAIDDSGCTGTASVIITQPSPIVMNPSQTDVDCHGNCDGTAGVSPSGGTPAYTYKWLPGGQTTPTITGLCAGSYTVNLTDANGCKDSAIFTITEPTTLSSSLSKTDIDCNGNCDGKASVTTSGGTPAYTYKWSTGATTTNINGLCAGSYWVKVTDAHNCFDSISFTITQPPAINLNPVTYNIDCNGKCDGAATVHPTGGTAPYTYAWNTIPVNTSDSIGGLCPGNYKIVVTDKNGCKDSTTLTITQPPAITISISSNNISCSGNCDGSATATVSGGTGAYTYSWAPGGQTTSGITGLCAGSYTVTVTDANGCTASASVKITQPNPLSVSLTASPNPLKCFGDKTATISSAVSGGTAPYTYKWAPGGQTTPIITGQGAGTYTLVVTDANGCKDSSKITINQPPQLRDSITASSNIACNGGSGGSATVGVKGGSPGYTYSWAPSGGSGPSANNLTAGTYTVTVTDKDGCSVTASVTITQPPALSLSISNTGEKCNGDANGYASVTASGGASPYTFAWSPGGGTNATDSNLAIGCYTVTVTDKNGCTATASTCITQPPPLSAIISSTTSSCSICDGSAKVSASGGTAPYTYQWNTIPIQTSDSATGLCVGIYTVTVTDAHGCTATAKATIIPTVKIVVTTSANTVSCDSSCDGVATANPSGGNAPYTYSWTTIPTQTNQTATGLCAGSYTVTVTDKNGCKNVDSVTFINPPKLTVSTTQSNVTCSGKCNGSATANASGGTGAYTYYWSPGGQTTQTINSLCVGNDTVTVTDASGCTATAVVTITDNGSMNDNPTVVEPTCGASNGSITLNPTGGTAPYTYTWAPAVSVTNTAVGLSAGTYTVTITDNTGCSQTFFVLLNNVSGPTLTGAVTNATCPTACDGMASVTVTAGVSPYTYLWNTGATTTSIAGLCPGVYVCTVTDANGCVTNISDTVKKPIPISPNPGIQNIGCNGDNDGKITLGTTGGTSPYTYSWSDGNTKSSETGLSQGTYTITVSDNIGCDTVITVTITEPPALVVTITATNVTCNGDDDGSATANVSGGTVPYIYNWSNGGVVPTIVNLAPGTYTLTVHDVNGCTETASVTITQPAPLNGVITPINVSCNLGSDGGATVVTTGGTKQYTYNWSDGQTGDTLKNVSIGTYYLTITDSNGCTYNDSVKIIQPPPINITFTAQNDFCNGDCSGTAQAVISGGTGPFTYSWNTVPVQTNQTATGLCAGSYVVTVTDANGCTASNTVTIGEPPVLSANPSATSTSCSTACDGTASCSPTGGTGPYTYKWSNGATTSAISGLCGGNDTVIVTDKNGCADTAIVVVPKPSPITISSSTSPSNCNTSNGSITITASGGTPAYSYLWSPGGQTTTTVNGLSAGIYTVTVTDAKGCDSTFAIILNNTGGPSSFTNTQSNELCFGDSAGYIDALPNGGSLPYIYFWTNSPSPNGQGTDSIYNLTAGTYTLEVTDNNGCIQFDTVTVIQPPAINITGTALNATCAGVCTGSVTLTTSGGTGAYTYLWSDGSTKANVTGLCPGSYTVTVTDANGCKASQVFTIGQNISIAVSTAATGILCNGAGTGSATVTASGGGGIYTYKWSPGGQTNQTATNLTAGTYTILVTDQNGCQGTDSVKVIEPLPISVNLQDKPITCNNACDGMSYAATSGGTAPYTNHWSNGSTADTIMNECAGTFVDTVTDANGCIAIDSVTFINPPVMTENSIVTNASCNTTNDGDITITVTGGITPYTFSWSNGATTQNLTNVLPGKYVLTLTDSTGCVIIDTILLPSDTTVLAEAGNDTSFCQNNATITLDGTKSTNSTSYEWFQLPGYTPLGNTPVVTIPNPGLGSTVYVLVTKDGACSDTDSVTVTINPLPVADAGPSKSIVIYTSTTIGGSPTGPAGSTYHWSPSSGLGGDTNSSNPVASPTVTTTYTVTVTGPSGCISIDTVTVFVIPQIVIPNGFTPNGDGQNDTWVIKNIYLFPNAVVEVYNRWGEELFYSAGYKTPWDGTYNNKSLPVGTYYYIINLHDTRFPKAYTGPVTIMR